MELKELLDSKTFVKENSKIQFGSPASLVSPFLNIVGSSNFSIKVQNPVVNMNDDNSQNIAYPRVVVEADFGELMPEYNSVIGMIYALDIQHPQISVYAGHNAHACTNLTIFNADMVFQMNLTGNVNHAYDKARHYLENRAKEIEEFSRIREKLVTTFLNHEELKKELGRLLLATTRKGSKLPSSAITGSARLLQDRSSIYFVDQDDRCSLMNLYDSITQTITNSTDLLYKPNKTIAVSRLILN